jgi:outer membrane protein assembly factor BamB
MLASVGVALSLLTACWGGGSGEDGGDEQDGTPSGAPSSAALAAKVYDPPVKFEKSADATFAAGVSDGRSSVRLDGTTAYAGSHDALRAVSVLDGETRWTLKPQGRPSEDTDSGTDHVFRPAFGQIDGQRAVLAAFAVTVPGSGTTPDRPRVELTAAAVDSGKRLWSVTVDRPEGQEEGDPYLVGIDGTSAALRFGDDTDAVSLGFDLGTRKVTWTAKGFAADFVDGGVAVGRGDRSVYGLSLRDGKKAWTYMDRLNEATLTPVGGGLFTAVVRAPYEDESRIAALLASSTGKPPIALGARTLGDPTDLSCSYDERITIVCTVTKDFDQRLIAIDTKTRKVLWTISGDDKTRLMPDVSAVWHGAIYGSTENGPVVLDARTGEDKSTTPGLTPFAVNGYVGLDTNSQGEIQAHRAVG